MAGGTGGSVLCGLSSRSLLAGGAGATTFFRAVTVWVPDPITRSCCTHASKPSLLVFSRDVTESRGPATTRMSAAPAVDGNKTDMMVHDPSSEETAIRMPSRHHDRSDSGA